MNVQCFYMYISKFLSCCILSNLEEASVIEEMCYPGLATSCYIFLQDMFVFLCITCLKLLELCPFKIFSLIGEDTICF